VIARKNKDAQCHDAVACCIFSKETLFLIPLLAKIRLGGNTVKIIVKGEAHVQSEG